MEGLVAEQQVDALICELKCGNVSAQDVDRQFFAGGLVCRALQAFFLEVDGDDPLRREVLLQRAERFSLAAADVEDDGPVRPPRLGNKPLEVLERDAYDARLPSLRAEKPEAESALGNEQTRRVGVSGQFL